MAPMKPGIASWLTVTSPVEGLVFTTLPRRWKTLNAGIEDDCCGAVGEEWHPERKKRATAALDSRKRTINTSVYEWSDH